MANYTFTQPIRYFKANDPYYYEVDNIPLRQLEENILFIHQELKSQFGGKGGGPEGGGGGSGGALTSDSELDITKISNLKPAKLFGRTVRVRKGRFNAVIRDTNKSPLVKVGLTTPGIILSDLSQAPADTIANVWNAFVESNEAQGAAPYNMNGLEILHTFHITPGGLGRSWQTVVPTTGGNFPNYATVPNGTHKESFPIFNKYGPLTPADLANRISYTAENLGAIHLAFVNDWRAPLRTSVVDFPEDLELEIPEWDNEDFYYYDAEGNKQQITDATQRIDLLVAYALPIDANSATLPDYSGGFCNAGIIDPAAKTITAPTLGLIKGAGLGIRRDNVRNSIETTGGCGDPGSPGAPRILSNQNDSLATANQGILDSEGVIVHGSFPSPDDLANLAPLAALDVEDGDFQLIGQAALPLAYIVVKKESTEIADADVIDIRPFLRTTEFTYNERAGIGAANPPLSFANPAVGAYQLQTAINSIDHPESGGSDLDGVALYTDYVMGGLGYGPEGTLLSMCPNSDAQDTFGTNTTNATYTDPITSQNYSFSALTSGKKFLENEDQTLREAFLQWVYNEKQDFLKRWISDPNNSYPNNTGTYLGLPSSEGRNIPLYPEWDAPLDGTNLATVVGESAKPTLWMWLGGQSSARPVAYVPGGGISKKATVGGSAWLDKQYGLGYGEDPTTTGGFEGTAAYAAVTKKLEITFPSWVTSYDILVEYTNCNPVTFQSSNSTAVNFGLGSGLYVNLGPVVDISGQKKAIATINSIAARNSSLVAGGRIADVAGDSANAAERKSSITNDLVFQWLSYGVILPQFKNLNWNMMQQTEANNTTTRYAAQEGLAYYPTVKFTIIGYKSNPVTKNLDYSPTSNWTLYNGGVSGGRIDNLIQNTIPVQRGSLITIPQEE